jgi:serine/threonine protein kinase
MKRKTRKCTIYTSSKTKRNNNVYDKKDKTINSLHDISNKLFNIFDTPFVKMMKGGKAIGAGGYGCVFEPALKCKNENKRNSGYVSKLMTSKAANHEFNYIRKIQSFISKIPNYNRYFLLDYIYLCEPEKISSDDYLNFDRKCGKDSKINAEFEHVQSREELNSKLDKYNILNIPYGGISVERFLRGIELFYDFNIFINLNNCLIELLTNAIIPMNKLGVYHRDLKVENILISSQTYYNNQKNEFISKYNGKVGGLKNKKKDLNTKLGGTSDAELDLTKLGKENIIIRIIDWGLSVISPHGSVVYSETAFHNRTLSYNMPFSILLFNENFQSTLVTYSKNWGANFNNLSFDQKEQCVYLSLLTFFDTSLGHIQKILSMYGKMLELDYSYEIGKFMKEETLEIYTKTYVISLISEYITKILVKYIHNDGTIDLENYYANVFKYNVDIWGFTSVYVAIFNNVYNVVNKKTPPSQPIVLRNFLLKLRNLFFKTLFESPTEKIDVDKYILNLKELNNLSSANSIPYMPISRRGNNVQKLLFNKEPKYTVSEEDEIAMLG